MIAGAETVLVVEDQPEVRKYAAAVLGACGYRVIEAGSAGEALVVFERDGRRAALVLTDVVMPRAGGRELAERLLALRPDIRVLYMSGYAIQEMLRQGMPDEGAAFLQKPFGPDELAAKVREVLGAAGPGSGMPAFS